MADDTHALQRFCSNFPLLVAYVDEQQTVALCSGVAAQVIGRPSAEVVGQRLDTAFAGFPGVADSVRRTLASGETQVVSLQVQPPGARDRPRHYRVTVVRDAWLAPGALVVGEETTAEHEAEAQRRHLERVKALGDALTRINVLIHSVMDFDEIMRRVLVEAAEAVGAESGVIYVREGAGWVARYTYGRLDAIRDRRFSDEDLRDSIRALRDGVTVMTNDAAADPDVNRELVEHYGVRAVLDVGLRMGQQPVGDFGLYHHSPDHRFTEAEKAFMDSAGAAVGVALQNASRIAALQQAETALRESQRETSARVAELEAVLEAVPAIVLIAHDPACRHVSSSPAGDAVLGLPPGSNQSPFGPAGDGPVAFTVFRDGEPVPAQALPLQRAARGEAVAEDGLELHFADGHVRFITGSAVPLRDPDGTPRGAVAAFVDITGRAQAEEALRRVNAELEQFAYVASHDLKAPLRAIAQLASWVDEDAAERLDEENRQRLRLMRERVIRMDRLIEGLLAYSRAARVSGEVREPTALQPLLEQLVDELALPEGFRVQIEGPLPVLRADALHLHQVFQNLIANAADHHDHAGTGTVWISATEEGRYWRLEVADDGPGVPPEQRERVFRMFTSGGPGGSRHTGIGLAVVSKLVRSYGGRLELTDNLPRGALFRIWWPK